MLAFAQFISAIDYNIVYVALPEIGRQVGFSTQKNTDSQPPPDGRPRDALSEADHDDAGQEYGWPSWWPSSTPALLAPPPSADFAPAACWRPR
ncbi:hypothetical protein ACWEQG_27250 [Microbispora sp. NPDC004025]